MGYNMKRGAAPKFKDLGSSPAKKDDAKTGHGAKSGPDVYYTRDGKSKQVANIDEENLENKVRKDLAFGRFVVHTNPDTGKKTKYYFKKP